MLVLKNKIYFYILSFFLISTVINIDFIKNIKTNLSVKNIEIVDKDYDFNDEIYNKLNYIIEKNIFFLDQVEILNELKDLNFLQNIKIKKIYPSKIIITFEKTNLLGITYKNQKRYFVGANEQFIEKKKIRNVENLPLIFGNFLISDLKKLQYELSNKNINIDKIEKYFYHKNKRWDIYFKNGIVLKLPNRNLDKILETYKKFLSSNSVEKDSIIDLRMENRIIISNE